MSLFVDIRKTLDGFTLHAAFETEELVTGLLGASGCGKSLTLQCIAGVLRPDTGKIVLDGETLFDSARSIDLPPQKRRVGYLFQHYALFPHWTVERNLCCALHHVRDKGERQRRLRGMVARMQLSGLENHRPAQLSGGQAQRAALARMLLSEPRLLLLDEPFSALDSHLREQLAPDLLDLLRAYGRQAVLVTHSREEAYQLTRRLCVMDSGRIVRADATRAVFDDPQHLAAARLTGCINHSRADKTGAHTLDALDCGIALTPAAPVPESVQAVGLRPHGFDPAEPHNRFAVRWAETVETPTADLLRCRTAAQDETAPPLRWERPKTQPPAPLPDALGIAPQHVLPLI